MEIWFKGMVAAGISGAAGGVMTGLAAVGIDPGHFNLQAGVGATVRNRRGRGDDQCGDWGGGVFAEVAVAGGEKVEER